MKKQVDVQIRKSGKSSMWYFNYYSYNETIKSINNNIRIKSIEGYYYTTKNNIYKLDFSNPDFIGIKKVVKISKNKFKFEDARNYGIIPVYIVTKKAIIQFC